MGIDKLDRDLKKDERRTKKRLERDQRWDREVLRAKRITLTKVEDLDKGTVANTVQDLVDVDADRYPVGLRLLVVQLRGVVVLPGVRLVRRRLRFVLLIVSTPQWNEKKGGGERESERERVSADRDREPSLLGGIVDLI